MLHNQKVSLVSKEIINFKGLSIKPHDIGTISIDENFNVYAIYRHIPRTPECINVDNFLIYLSKNHNFSKSSIEALSHQIELFHEECK